MTKTSKPTTNSGSKLVFFGNERLATGVKTDAPVLKALLEAGYDIAAVVTNYEAATSRSSRDLEIAKVAKEHSIPVLIPNKLSEIKDQLKGFGAPVGVLVAYGKIVPQEIIDIFPKGIVNIHPSLLPKHRGPTPIETVILEGDSKTGVSLMLLAKEMDAGSILVQKTVHLKGTETKQELADQLLELGKELMLEYLPKYITDDIKPRQQSHPSRSTYSKKITKDDGLIDWSKSGVQIERDIRGYAEWPKSRTKLNDIEVIITEATYRDPSTKLSAQPGEALVYDKRLFVATGDGALEIIKLKPAGKSEMSAQAFLAGYKIS